MSMDSDVGNAVGGAALGGLALGLAYQFGNPGAAWRAHKQHLENQVASLQTQLQRANFSASTSFAALGRSDQRINELNSKIQQVQGALDSANRKLGSTAAELAAREANLERAERELARREAQLTATERELLASRAANEASLKKVAALNDLVDLMIEKRSALEHALTRHSANAFVLNKLYDRLVDEITHVSNPENFEALDPEYLLRVVTEEWEDYEETGEMVYRPRIKALPEDAQSAAFGGAEAQEADEDATKSLLSASSKRP